MAKKFKDIASALNYISGQIDKTLLTEVQKTVKQTEIKHINSVVYSSYSPVMYTRRMSGGGLSDESNMVGTLVGKNTLSVKNETPSSPSVVHGGVSNHLAQWVVSGMVKDIFHGQRRFDYPWTSERDFITPTVSELNGGLVEQKLRSGLRARGLQVK